jgi:hypothetical protein
VLGLDLSSDPEIGLGSVEALADAADEGETMSITTVEGGARVIKTVTEDDSQTLTLTVTEPVTDEVARLPRAITAEDSAEVSGTISVAEGPRPRRAKRHSEIPEE